MWLEEFDKSRQRETRLRSSFFADPATNKGVVAFRLLKLEGAMNKGDVVLLLDCGFVYNKLLSRLFWLCVFFSLVCSTHFLFNTK